MFAQIIERVKYGESLHTCGAFRKRGGKNRVTVLLPTQRGWAVRKEAPDIAEHHDCSAVVTFLSIWGTTGYD